jgi:hypothetical protein
MAEAIEQNPVRFAVCDQLLLLFWPGEEIRLFWQSPHSALSLQSLRQDVLRHSRSPPLRRVFKPRQWTGLTLVFRQRPNVCHGRQIIHDFRRCAKLVSPMKVQKSNRKSVVLRSRSSLLFGLKNGSHLGAG